MSQCIYGINTGSQRLTIQLPDTWRRDGTGKVIIGHHGHGIDSKQFCCSQPLYDHARRWADHGYAVVCPDGSPVGSYQWGSDTDIALHDDAVTYAASSTGIVYGNTTKVGVFGYSGGGHLAANVLKRKTNLACMLLWSPLLDLSWADSLAGYTPAYSTGGDTASAGWAAEIAAAYGSWAATAGHRVMDEPASFAGLNVPTLIIVPSDDEVVPPAAADYWVGQVNDPNITVRSPKPTGGHTASFPNVPTAETLTFFGAHL